MQAVTNRATLQIENNKPGQRIFGGCLQIVEQILNASVWNQSIGGEGKTL
jgi:hypothetical protein